jgi:FAD:protein FMN transferase
MRPALCFLLVLLGCSNTASGEPRVWSAEVMTTRVDVQFAGATGTEADAQAVFQIFRDVDDLASEWKDGSPLALLNADAGGDARVVPDELFQLLQRSVALAEATNGAFDPTWAALWGLWDFKAEAPGPPDEAERLRRVALIDWHKLVLDEGAKSARLAEKGMLVGLGGIGKGWALDRSVAMLTSRGVTDYVLSAGGQVYAVGMPAQGRPWNVGVRDPRGDASDWFAVVAVSGASVSTSGDYERWFEFEGVRYHHILDPRNGLPGRRFRSVTVVSSDATEADALSTALMLLPIEDGRRVAKEQGVQVVWVDAAGAVHRTGGLGAAYSEKHPPRAAAPGAETTVKP